MHSIDENFGGHLSPAEIGIIGGALDLTHKTAAQGMTPLEQVCGCPVLAQAHRLTWDHCLLGCSVALACCRLCCVLCCRAGLACVLQPPGHADADCSWLCVQVFALPTDAILNVETLRSILATGHSRVPVHAPGNK